MTLCIQDGATIVFALAPNHTKRNEAGSSRLETEFTVAAAHANLSRRSQGVKARINGTIGATNGTAEDGFLFVDGVFHTHDCWFELFVLLLLDYL